MKFDIDKIVFRPGDVDLLFSPLRKDINVETYVLGAFNPGMTRLPNGNLLIMVRVAEALKESIYLTDVVFTTGIADVGNHFVVASGELDLACRITHVPKSVFKL